MSSFETNPKSLKFLLSQIQNKELALPDFQRDFVWDPGAVEELIESIMRNYPAGSLLFLRHKGIGFEIREFEGAPPIESSQSVSFLTLDGQQRLTSLYQAFAGKGEHRFILNVRELIDSEDIEAAVTHETSKRFLANGYDKIEVQADKLLCPLQVLMGSGFNSWIHSVMRHRTETGEAADQLLDQLLKINQEWIQPILDYQFPVVTLSENTELDAVCTMFETLNRRGVKLTVFELLMARSFAGKVSLRTLWQNANNEYPILEQFEIDPYYVLQSISLLNGKGIKRSEILDIDPNTVADHWSVAIKAMADSLEFLRAECGVVSASLLPYHTMIVPMSAAWAKTSSLKGPKELVRKQYFEQWFWASVFAQTYEKGPTSRAVKDFKELEAWILKEERAPYALQALYFNEKMFFDVTHKQRAVYRGSLALVLSQGAKDFHRGSKIDFNYIEKNKVDDHHVFPQNYLKKKGDTTFTNCVLNKTLIDKVTNIRISDKAPSKYIKEIADHVDSSALDEILKSHQIEAEFLKSDKFQEFLAHRAQSLLGILKKKLRQDIPANPPQYVDQEDDLSDEGSNAKEKEDPQSINAHPTQLLVDVPQEFNEIVKLFNERISKQLPDVWWVVKPNRVIYRSPEKMLMRLRVSRGCVNLKVFTDGKPLNGVEPIVQRDRGGELWGRVKLKKLSDVESMIKIAEEAHSRFRQANLEGRNTSWFAMGRKTKDAA